MEDRQVQNEHLSTEKALNDTIAAANVGLYEASSFYFCCSALGVQLDLDT